METESKTGAALQAIKIIADCIKEAGGIPSGHLYALLLPYGITIQGYNNVIGVLQRANLIAVNNDFVTWIG